MNQTLNKIKRLEKFIAYNDTGDQVLDTSINKILHREINKLQTQIERFNYQINQFKEKYNLDSIIFEKEFEKGELGDNIDFIEWISTIEMKRKAEKYISTLQGE